LSTFVPLLRVLVVVFVAPCLFFSQAGSVKMLLHGAAEHNYSNHSLALGTFESNAAFSRGEKTTEQAAVEAFETLLAATHSARRQDGAALRPLVPDAERRAGRDRMKTPLGSALGAAEEPAATVEGDDEEDWEASLRADKPAAAAAVASSSSRSDLAALKHALVATGVVDPAFFLTCADWFDHLADPTEFPAEFPEQSRGAGGGLGNSFGSSFGERRVSAATLRRLEHALARKPDGAARLARKLGQARAQVSSAAAPALDRMRARVSALGDRVGEQRRSHERSVLASPEGAAFPEAAAGNGLSSRFSSGGGAPAASVEPATAAFRGASFERSAPKDDLEARALEVPLAAATAATTTEVSRRTKTVESTASEATSPSANEAPRKSRTGIGRLFEQYI
jgi:hypothetical protein